MAYLNYAGLSHYRQKTIEYLNGKISRDELAFVDKRFKWINDLMNGQKFDVLNSADTAYSKVVPAGAKVVAVNKLGGKSRVKNNIMTNSEKTVTSSGISFRYNPENGSLTFSGTRNSSSSSPFITFISATPVLPTGHKFFLFGVPKEIEGSSNFVFFVQNSAGGYSIADQGEGGIGVINATDKGLIFRLPCPEGTVIEETTIYLFAVDLTMWFSGEDISSLTSASDPRLDEVKSYLADHPEYNAGEIVSAQCEQIVSEGKNLLPFKDVNFTTKGMRFYSNNGTMYFDGTTTGEISSGAEVFQNNIRFKLKPGTYYFNRGNVNTATYIYAYPYVAGESLLVTNSGSFTLEEETALFIGFYMNNKTYSNFATTAYLVRSDTGHSFTPYFRNVISIPDQLREDYPLRSAGTVHDEYDFERMKFVQKVGSRAYQEGDEDDSTVITDGATTFYPLTTPTETDISSYFTDDDFMLAVEAGGSITFEQTDTEFAVPNDVDYAIKLSEVAGG